MSLSTDRKPELPSAARQRNSAPTRRLRRGSSRSPGNHRQRSRRRRNLRVGRHSTCRLMRESPFCSDAISSPPVSPCASNDAEARLSLCSSASARPRSPRRPPPSGFPAAAHEQRRQPYESLPLVVRMPAPTDESNRESDKKKAGRLRTSRPANYSEYRVLSGSTRRLHRCSVLYSPPPGRHSGRCSTRRPTSRRLWKP